MPGDMASVLVLYWTLRGEQARARAFLRRVDRLRALLAEAKGLPPSTVEQPEATAKRSIAEFRSLRQQISTLKLVISQLKQEARSLGELDLELRSLPSQGSPILQSPNVQAALVDVIKALPESLAQVQATTTKMEAKLKVLEERYRQRLRALL